VFDINGVSSTVEDSMQMLKKIAPQAQITLSGEPLPFPMNLSDEPVRGYLGNYGSVPIEQGIKGTYEAFGALLERGALKADSIN
jgi:hypothetical protein